MLFSKATHFLHLEQILAGLKWAGLCRNKVTSHTSERQFDDGCAVFPKVAR